MKKNVKYVGIEEGRECYQITIRKGHEKEAIAEMVKIQEKMRGKQRFKVFFENMSEKEAVDFTLAWNVHNFFLNTYMRKDYQVMLQNIKSAEL